VSFVAPFFVAKAINTLLAIFSSPSVYRFLLWYTMSAIVPKPASRVMVAKPMWNCMLLGSIVANCEMLTPQITVEKAKRPLIAIPRFLKMFIVFSPLFFDF
jgi:hypothetical protein